VTTEPSSSLIELADRVRRLEEIVEGRAAAGQQLGDGADPFWILDGLEQRHGVRAVAYWRTRDR
jgi:hypothetical protein